MLGGARRCTTRAAIVASAAESMTRGKLYSCDAVLERLAQGLEAMTAEFGEFIPEEHTMVRQGHLTGQGHLATAHEAQIGDEIIGGAAGPRGHARRAPVGEAGGAVDAGRLDGLGPASGPAGWSSGGAPA